MNIRFEFIKKGNVWIATCPFCESTIERDDPAPTECSHYISHDYLAANFKVTAATPYDIKIYATESKIPVDITDSAAIIASFTYLKGAISIITTIIRTNLITKTDITDSLNDLNNLLHID